MAPELASRRAVPSEGAPLRSPIDRADLAAMIRSTRPPLTTITGRFAPSVAGALLAASMLGAGAASGATLAELTLPPTASSSPLGAPRAGAEAFARCAGPKFEGPWRAAERARIEALIQRLSSAERARLEGVVIARGGREVGLSGRYEGRYATGRIVYFDSAFAAPRLSRSIARSDRDWVLYHELGHAIMYGADRLAAAHAQHLLSAYDASVEALTSAKPGTPERVAAREAVLRAQRAYDDAFARVDYGSNQLHFERATTGHTAVTAYGSTHVDEAFAEAFAMYKTQPGALAALDLALHDYFARGSHVVDWEERGDGTLVARGASAAPTPCASDASSATEPRTELPGEE
ncbi:hypothetical protein L6R52_42715 [Myxococcota bacterium]|nr:hypothetical protein [Myxococcota bacterium]